MPNFNHSPSIRDEWQRIHLDLIFSDVSVKIVNLYKKFHFYNVSCISTNVRYFFNLIIFVWSYNVKKKIAPVDMRAYQFSSFMYSSFHYFTKSMNAILENQKISQ